MNFIFRILLVATLCKKRQSRARVNSCVFVFKNTFEYLCACR